MNNTLWLAHLEENLSEYFKKTILIYIVEQIDGGSINQTERLETNHGDLFIKWNSALHYPNMFNREYESIQLLANSNSKTPLLHIKGNYKDRTYLVMEYISQGIPNSSSWISLGEQVALVHKNTKSYFGFSNDNYFGSLHQSNSIKDNWTEFFMEERILPQIQLANKLIPQATKNKFKSLEYHIRDFPGELPSLLHGDLWSGNVMFNKKGDPYLIDPAIYFGNREVDIAMTKLFGGFSDEFYDSYNSNFPLKDNWEDRIDIWNLYPLLVHLNLFGPSYLPKINSILNKM